MYDKDVTPNYNLKGAKTPTYYNFHFISHL